MTAKASKRFDFDTVASKYDAWYETDAGRLHDAAQKKTVLSMLPRPLNDKGKKRSLLDAGCGTGHWSVFFAKQGFNVTGVDISPEMIATAQARNAPCCRFAGADIMKLPFLSGDFDIVSAMATLEFVADALQACAEMTRCLKPGGCLLVGVLNRLAGINRQRIAEHAEPYASARLFTPAEFRRLLAPFGKVEIRLTTENEPGKDKESGAFMIATVIKP